MSTTKSMQRARTETKNLPKNEISVATRINLESCQSNKTCYSKPSNRLRLKIVTKVNGKDVLWSTYTLRFTNTENFFRLARKQR